VFFFFFFIVPSILLGVASVNELHFLITFEIIFNYKKLLYSAKQKNHVINERTLFDV